MATLEMKTMSKSEEIGDSRKKKNGSRFETKTEHIDDKLIAHRKSQTCDDDDNFALNLAEEDAEEKEDSKVVQILRNASTHMAWDLVFILLTFYALFVPDIVKMQPCATVDAGFEWFNYFVFVAFIVEIIVMAITLDSYTCKGDFFLDVLAGVSMLFDCYPVSFLMWKFSRDIEIATEYADTPGYKCEADGEFQTALLQFPHVVNALRTARASRLLKLLRIIRLTRITKLIRVVDLCQGKKKKTQAEKVVMVDGEEKERADTFSESLPKRIILWSVVGCLLILFFMPFLENCVVDITYREQLLSIKDYYEYQNASHPIKPAVFDQLVTQSVRAYGGVVENAFASPWIESLQSLHDVNFVCLMLNGTLWTDVITNDTSWMPNCPTRRSDYRVWRECRKGTSSPTCSIENPVISIPHLNDPESLCQYEVDDGCDFVSIFYVHDQTMLDALSSLSLTCLALGLLVVMMAIFNRDAKNMSQQINQPLNALTSGMELVARMEFTDEEIPKSSIYEINIISKSFKKLRRSMQSFAKYLDYKVVVQLMNSQDADKGAKRYVSRQEVSIMFCHLQNIDEIKTRGGERALMEALTHYFESTSAIISENGTLLEFIGDEVMAIWNAPKQHELHTARALAQGLKVIQCFRTLKSAKVKARDVLSGKNFPAIVPNIGLHTGMVFVGNMGASDRLKYGVLGDSVNLSARLSRLNSRYGTSLLVSDDVLQEPTVEDTFLVRLIDKVAVKGRTHATKISEVMAVKEEASEELTTFVAQHNRGMDLYFDRQFNDAIKTFENAMEIYGQKDRALQLLCEKCRKFIENPPPVGWDGTDVLKAKHF